MRGRLFVALSLIATVSLGQIEPSREFDLERLVDEIYGLRDLDLNYEDLYENLAQLLSNPLDLNKVSAEQLRSLYILSESQIQSFIDYRSANELLSIYELQAIPEFDVHTIQILAPFVKVNTTIFSKGTRSSYLLLRYERTLEPRRGFTSSVSPSSQFKGNEDRYYLRFKDTKTGNYSLGFTAEKDAGEQLTWNPSQNQYGADYFSFHAQLLNKGRIKNLIIGDFQGQFGQGITLGSAFGFGKGAETILTTRRSNLGFLPYSSVTEFNFLRGIATTVEIAKQIHFSGFYSKIKRDANISSDSIDNITLSGFQTTGLHRNENELNDRKQINEENIGASIHYQSSKFQGGLIFNQVNLNKPLVRRITPYNQFAFQGSTYSNAGAFVNYTINNFTLFGEFSQTMDHGNATALGLLGSITPLFDIALHFRNYQRDYISLYSNAFAESSATQNEKGLYWGWKYKATKQLTVAGYVDLFMFPWLRYRSYAPSQGHEWLFRVTYQPSKKIAFFIQAREEKKDRNITDHESSLHLTLPGTKRNYWINCEYNVTASIKLRNRIQYSDYSINSLSSSGFMLLQDVIWKHNKISITARHAIFDTDDFDNRQYVYEHDVWLAYSLPAYSGVGIRNYFVIQYNLTKSISIWLRYSRFQYANQATMGSGVDAIEGNTRNDLKFQVRITL